MHIPLAQQEIIQIVMAGTLTATGAVAKPVNQVYYFRRTTPALPWTKAQINTAFQTVIGAVALAAFNAAYTQTANIIRCINDNQDPPESFTQAGVGAVAGDRLPSNATVVMQLKSPIRQAWAQGRKFYAGITEADTTMDLLSGAGLVRWQALRDILYLPFADAGANTYQLCILAATTSNLVSDPTTVYTTDCNNVILNKTVSTYKKRKQKTIQ